VLALFVLATLLLAPDWVLDPDLPHRLTESDLVKGEALYRGHCQRCHGVDGDDVSYSYITPLAGLSLRLSDPRIGQFHGPSFHLRGRLYPPEEARNLMAYILTLPGEKGFRRPDALVSPYLLAQKLGNRNYLLIDTRSDAEFRKGHIPGAVKLPPSSFQKLALPALAPDLENQVFVLYDDGSGPGAAKLWYQLNIAGCRRVAVLDGGFKRWASENREISTEVQPHRPTALRIGSEDPEYPSSLAGPQLAGIELSFDWRRTVTEAGVRHASELTAYLQSAGFRGAGRYRLQSEEAAHMFAFQMHLLGYTVKPGALVEIIVH
jgi:rhodanese-related sulfurtransferase/mono/diheme cytochrome c family protein